MTRGFRRTRRVNAQKYAIVNDAPHFVHFFTRAVVGHTTGAGTLVVGQHDGIAESRRIVAHEHSARVAVVVGAAINGADRFARIRLMIANAFKTQCAINLTLVILITTIGFVEFVARARRRRLVVAHTNGFSARITRIKTIVGRATTRKITQIETLSRPRLTHVFSTWIIVITQ